MLIKQQALRTALQQYIAPLYVLFGQDYFLLEQATLSIKQFWKKYHQQNYEEKIVDIINPTDWYTLAEKTNSYSLFASQLLLDVRYEKKSFDVEGKKFLTRYVQESNTDCLLLIRSPYLTQKQLDWLIPGKNACLVQIHALNEWEMHQWIIEQLQKAAFKFEKDIPKLIQQHTQGNLLACSQVIEKLSLVLEKDTIVTTELIQEHLIDQCTYQLFELAEACLQNKPEKAILLLRHAASTKVEPTLILWILMQEIRLLIQLIERSKSVSFNVACSQLKIWPQRAKQYQTALARLNLDLLYKLMLQGRKMDEYIKSTQSDKIWHAFEKFTLSLCLAKQVGHLA